MRSKPRKFHFFGPKLDRSRAVGIELLNPDAVIPEGKTLLLPPSYPDLRGLPSFKTEPRFLIGDSKKSPPRDLEYFHNFFLISDVMKTVLEAVDHNSFEFRSCTTVLPNGAEGSKYWLCDVLPILDAVDEVNSKIKIHTENGTKRYGMTVAELTMRDEAIDRDVHAFRLKYAINFVYCDDLIRQACRDAGLKGIEFRDVAKPY